MAIDFRGNEYKYSWGSEQEDGPTLDTINSTVASVRMGLSYDFKNHHKVLLNYMHSSIDRKDSDALRSVLENTFRGTSGLHKNILSFTYELNAFDDRLTANVFGKHYQQKTVNIGP